MGFRYAASPASAAASLPGREARVGCASHVATKTNRAMSSIPAVAAATTVAPSGFVCELRAMLALASPLVLTQLPRS